MTSRNTEVAKALTTRTSSPKSRFFRDLGKKLHWLKTREIIFQIILFGFLTLVVVLLASPAPIRHQVGDVAEYTIRADDGFRMIDQGTTEMRQREAVMSVPPVLVLDDVFNEKLEEEAAAVFRRGRELTSGVMSPLTPEELADRQKDLESLSSEFFRIFNVPRDSRVWDMLLRKHFNEVIERQALSLSMEVMSQGLLDRHNPFVGKSSRSVSIHVVSAQTEYTLSTGAGLFDDESARRFLDMRSRALRVRFSQEDTRLILALAMGLMQPNLKPDTKETQRRMDEALASVQPAYIDIRAGEVVVREGSIVTPEVLEKIKIMNGASSSGEWMLRLFGFFLVLFVFFNSSLLLAHIGPKICFRPVPMREQVFTVLLLLLVALMAHNALLFGSSLAWDFDFLDSHTVFYAMPIPMATMLVAIFFGVRKAAFMALFAGVVAAAVTPPGARLLAFLYCYNGAIAAAWCLRKMNERGHLIPASLMAMAVNCLTLVGLICFTEVQWGRQTAYNFLAASASGALSGIIASGMIPLMELLFGFSTNVKLMELGNLDRPILRELMLSAPGTYHHSVIVGAMVEAAAESIGANPHLAKVGAYYHDIGKMKKPLYFVENQSGENRHDTLAPSMSALILIGHVREGVELAKESNLPQGLVDIIEQHHGTSLMAFFYHKAKEMRQEGQPEVNEGDYRYPGPKPRSREAGLVMLADICEAATRSLSEPTPAKIKAMVRQLVNQVFSDGQLDQCELQTREISEVVNTFTNILTGIYHRRVAYPGAKKAENDSKADEKKEMKESREAAAPVKPEVKDVYGHILVEQPKNTAH